MSEVEKNERKKLKILVVGLLLTSLLSVGLISFPADGTVGTVDLRAKYVETAPVIDGVADDAVWNDAVSLTVVADSPDAVQDGADVTMKALYDDTNIYMLFVWTDPTNTESHWVNGWQWNGSAFEAVPNANPDIYSGGQEDRFAVAWNINATDFELDGCTALCHDFPDQTDESSAAAAKSGMYTEVYGEETDEWHWKAGRSNALGILHDKYVGYLDADGTAAADWDVEAGHHSDEGGFYGRNRNPDKTAPVWFEPNPVDETDATFLLQSEIDSGEAIPVLGNESMLTIWQKIPGRVLCTKNCDGDTVNTNTGNTAAKAVFTDGVWTLEVSRALVNDDIHDVQFADTSADVAYSFAVAVFDDGGHFPQHAFQELPSTLGFAPPPPPDADGDGIEDSVDTCPNTAVGATVSATGCSDAQIAAQDADGDGVLDDSDDCDGTIAGATVDANGCSDAQLNPATSEPDDDGLPGFLFIGVLGVLIAVAVLTRKRNT